MRKPVYAAKVPCGAWEPEPARCWLPRMPRPQQACLLHLHYPSRRVHVIVKCRLDCFICRRISAEIQIPTTGRRSRQPIRLLVLARAGALEVERHRAIRILLERIVAAKRVAVDGVYDGVVVVVVVHCRRPEGWLIERRRHHGYGVLVLTH